MASGWLGGTVLMLAAGSTCVDVTKMHCGWEGSVHRNAGARTVRSLLQRSIVDNKVKVVGALQLPHKMQKNHALGSGTVAALRVTKMHTPRECAQRTQQF
jgi:hypothetical protein